MMNTEKLNFHLNLGISRLVVRASGKWQTPLRLFHTAAGATESSPAHQPAELEL